MIFSGFFKKCPRAESKLDGFLMVGMECNRIVRTVSNIFCASNIIASTVVVVVLLSLIVESTVA